MIGLATDAIPDTGKQLANPWPMITLQFNPVVFKGSAGTTGILQLREQVGELVFLRRQPSDGGHEFPAFAFFQGQTRRLFGWWRQCFTRRRALAILFQFVTAVTARWTVPGSSLKQSHEAYPLILVDTRWQMAGNDARSQYEKPNPKNRTRPNSCAVVAPVVMLLVSRSSVEYKRESLGGEKTSQHGRVPAGLEWRDHLGDVTHLLGAVC